MKGKTAGNDWFTFSYHDSTVSMNTNGVSMLKRFVFALAFTMWWKVECQSFKIFYSNTIQKMALYKYGNNIQMMCVTQQVGGEGDHCGGQSSCLI